MSWAGKHGTGYVMGQIKKLHPKMVLVATLSKSFGASGGIVVFPDEELYRKVKTFGGPQTFSAQLEPPMVAAALASAKIHLSDEIYDMQHELAIKINYCNLLLKQTDIPLVEENKCPVFFIGTGLPATGYNFVSRLMNEGFYVNLGVFPAVPVKNTGVRFTISRHNRLEDIEKLVDAIKYHYPKALADENRTQNQVRKAFNLPLVEEQAAGIAANNTLTLQHLTTIKAVDQNEWNSLLGGNGSFDWQGLQLMEKVFSANEKPEDNWEFHYYIVRDFNQKPVLATFFTINLWKEDMLAPASVSQQLEEKRKNNPYYLTSPVVNMGSLLTEGEHLYLDKTNPQWRKAVLQVLDAVSAEQERTNASMIVLRDFEDTDTELKKFLIDQGYFKINVPDTCFIENLTWTNTKEFLQTLSANARANVRKEALKYEPLFEVEVKQSVSDEELAYFYTLYQQVKARNFDLNVFEYPQKLFAQMATQPGWEFIVLKLKSAENEHSLPIAVIFSYKGFSNNYCPVLLGMDYAYLESHNVYRQALLQVVRRARQLNVKKVYLGLSAVIEKRKFGAAVISKVAYVQTKDNFNMEVIGTMSVENKK
jgi:predicted N-acyltransferase